MRYDVLLGANGCVFDQAQFSSLEDAKEWAKDRGSQEYACTIFDNEKEYAETFFVNKNKFKFINRFKA